MHPPQISLCHPHGKWKNAHRYIGEHFSVIDIPLYGNRSDFFNE
jgi:hypothetical protein